MQEGTVEVADRTCTLLSIREERDQNPVFSTHVILRWLVCKEKAMGLYSL